LDNLLFQLLEFQIQITAVRIGVGIVDSLNSELTHALHHVRDFVGRTFSRLNQVDGIARVAHRLIQASDLMCHTRCDRQARGVISRRVDALACRQLLHSHCHAAVRLLKSRL